MEKDHKKDSRLIVEKRGASAGGRLIPWVGGGWREAGCPPGGGGVYAKRRRDFFRLRMGKGVGEFFAGGRFSLGKGFLIFCLAPG